MQLIDFESQSGFPIRRSQNDSVKLIKIIQSILPYL